MDYLDEETGITESDRFFDHIVVPDSMKRMPDVYYDRVLVSPSVHVVRDFHDNTAKLMSGTFSFLEAILG